MRFRSCLTAGLAGALALGCPSLAFAAADAVLEVTVSPVLQVYPPGTTGEAWFSVTNHGPDPAVGPRVFLRSFAFGGINSQIMLSAALITDPCSRTSFDLDASPGFHGFLYLTLNYPDVPPGSTVQCGLQFEVQEFAWGTYSVDGTLALGPGSTDPDLSNNRDAVAMLFTAPETPAPVADLSVRMEIQPPASTYPPGSEVQLVVAVGNDGPAATGPSMVRFAQLRSAEAAAGVLITGVPPPGAGDNCRLILVDVPEAPGEQRLQLAVPGLRTGDEAICRLRLRIEDTAAQAFGLAVSVVSEPDFGTPTQDPVPVNDSATLLLRTAESVARPPVRIPATDHFALGLVALAILAASLRRARA